MQMKWLKIILGFLIIIFILWQRLFRTYFVNTYDSIQNIHMIQVIGVINLILVLCYAFYLQLLVSLNISKPETYLKKLVNKVVNQIYASLEEVFKLIVEEWLVKVLDFNDAWVEFFYNISKKYNKRHKLFLIIYYSYNLLPRLVVSLSLVYSVLFNNSLSLFYSSLILLIIPLIGLVLKYTIKRILKNVLIDGERYILFLIDPKSGKVLVSIPWVPFENEQDFNFFVDICNKCRDTIAFIEDFEAIEAQVVFYNMIVTLLFIVGWYHLLVIYLSKNIYF